MNRKISLTLALLICANLIACGNTSDASSDTTAETTEAQTTAEAAPTGLYYEATDAEIEKLGLDGYEFNVFMRAAGTWRNPDIAVEEANGDVFNDAVYDRQIKLQDRFGFTIKTTDSANTYGNELSSFVLAGDDTYDIAFPMASTAASCASQGVLMNLNDLEYFDIDSGAWSKMFCDTLTWNGSCYLAEGGISVNAYQSIRLMMFNKSLHENYKLDDPYALVRSGKWTLDVMNSMATAASADLNGDAAMTTLEDQWGMAWQSALAGIPFYVGAGELLSVKDANDIPKLSIGSERSYEVFEKIQKIFSNKDVYLTASDDDGKTIFREGHSLFFTEGMHLLEQLRDSEVSFGVLPMPKYDESQKEYVQYADSWCPSPVVVPITTKDPVRTGFFIQLLAETGLEYIKPVFYDKCLTGKYIRDDESAEMLDIIVNNFVLDNVVIYAWGSITSPFREALVKDTGLASLIATYESPINEAIKKTAAAYESIE